MRNLLTTMTESETGKVIWFKFEATNNQGQLETPDISDWAITITITKQSDEVVIDSADCVADADQVKSPGEGTFTFDAGQALLMTKGWYKYQITGVDNNGAEYVFPTTANTDHARLKVNKRL